MWKPIVVHVHGHAHALARAHAHAAVTAGLPKKAGVYLDSSALLIKKLLIAEGNKSLAEGEAPEPLPSCVPLLPFLPSWERANWYGNRTGV